jgi:hypothetical protein
MILKKAAGVCLAVMGACSLAASAAAQPPRHDAPSEKKEVRPLFPVPCDPALAGAFTPPQPLLGRYEVCPDPRPLAVLASAAQIEMLEAADAFGAAVRFDRSALVRLYRGTRAGVARGWTQNGDRFESVTLISPYPDGRFTRLESGTLIIRWICDRGSPECRIPAPR